MAEEKGFGFEVSPMVAVSDTAFCRDCNWSASYEVRGGDGKWRSKTAAKAKWHAWSTGHQVELRQTRFADIRPRLEGGE